MTVMIAYRLAVDAIGTVVPPKICTNIPNNPSRRGANAQEKSIQDSNAVWYGAKRCKEAESVCVVAALISGIWHVECQFVGATDCHGSLENTVVEPCL